MARCGWCITKDYANCVVVIKMGVTTDTGHKAKNRLPYFWTCSDNRLRMVKCVNCQRRGVDVDENWECRDRADCERYITERGPLHQPKPPATKEEPIVDVARATR